MCTTTDKTTEKTQPAAEAPAKSSFLSNVMAALVLVITICVIIMLAEMSVLVANSKNTIPEIKFSLDGSSNAAPSTSTSTSSATSSDLVPLDVTPETYSGTNVCEGKKPDLPNVECVVDAITNVGPQAGGNVTKGYNGDMEVDHVPITTPYWQNGMCPVNVHWHLGAEHLSVGQYDEEGAGPEGTKVRQGHQCRLYDDSDPKFTTPYEWKYCKDMEVGQTYEVHWPHSAAGACGTPNQYQTPFYDGVFCTDGVLTDTASQIGVQAQVFVIVNDDSYFWPDLMRGMIVDGEMGSDIAMYTGSTTGESRNNEICSQYSPITWQVDRKCHMISASAFDKLCYDMLQQRDDMSDDVHPHGSRETVADNLAANNHANRFLRKL